MSEQPSFDMLLSSSEFGDIDEIINDMLPSKQEPYFDAAGEYPRDTEISADPLMWDIMNFSDAESLFQDAPKLIDDGFSAEIIPPVSPVSSTGSTEICEVAICRKSDLLLKSFGLDDEQLSDMSLKKLRALCKSSADYNDLKAYRRTCLNRCYARSSRTKQLNKTTNLSVTLEETQKEVARLQKENDTKDATIRCLQLELRIMRSLERQ